MIKSGTEDDLGQYHFGLGMWIRNSWLWQGNSGIYKYFVLNGLRHPDDMSGIILDGFYYYLNDRDFDVEKAIYYYKKWWVIQAILNI